MSGDQKIMIEVDGRQLEASPGQTLIEVTDAAGIPIPRFCYHKKLSTAASCRMCLVEVEKAPKPLPACATPVSNGMKVYTRSPAALAAQKGTLEFLLINHPLDCPICDQGGECELQDLAMGYGQDVSRFAEAKRVVRSDDLGSLVATDMTRCIHCTRCVRFGDEIAGIREMGATGRGEHMKIGTFVAHAMTSELSGNIIDLCPVGALTAKPSRYSARAWELSQRDGIAPHDGLGSNLSLHVRRDRIMRVVPRENPVINETWISDRDRFAYAGLYAEDRLLEPMIRRGGKLVVCDWHDALVAAARILGNQSGKLGALVSPSATLEEMALTRKLMNGLGSAHIDHRLRQVDFRGDAANPARPWLGKRFQELSSNKATLLVGSWLRKDQPMLNHWLRQSVLAGGAVMALNPLDYEFNYPLAEKLICAPSEMVLELAAIAKAVGVDVGAINAKVEPRHQSIADLLKVPGDGSVLLGSLAFAHPDFALIRQLAAKLAVSTGKTLGLLPEGGNNLGAVTAGALPGQGGMNAGQMMAQGMDRLLLVNVEPEFDSANPQAMKALLKSAQVVALSGYLSSWLKEHAEVVLPTAQFGETSGTCINLQGDVQSFAGAVKPAGSSRPGWKILRVLGNLTNLPGFEYEDSTEVRDEVLAGMRAADNHFDMNLDLAPVLKANGGLQRLSCVPSYSVDALVRRSGALQKAADGWRSGLRINPVLAARQGLREGDSAHLKQGSAILTLPVILDVRVPDGCVWMPTAVPGSELLAEGFGAVALEKA